MKHPATAAALLALLAGPALADGGDRKQSYRDGRCKVEREWKKNGDYKEERQCDGARDDARRERKEEFRDGPCKVKREWKKNGDYLEEHQCDGRRTPRHGPWVVFAPGGAAPLPAAPPADPSPGRVGCNGEALGQVLGGSAQGVATVGGVVIGVLIGSEVGWRVDPGNRACIGAALEYGSDGQRVQWVAGPVAYTVVPGPALRRQGAWCRPYDAQWQERGAAQRQRGTACRRADGTWILND